MIIISRFQSRLLQFEHYLSVNGFAVNQLSWFGYHVFLFRFVDEMGYRAPAATSDLCSTRMESWEGRMQLYSTMIKSALLYGVQIWGFQYKQLVERVHSGFLRSLLYWPQNTPSYIVRLEIGTFKLEVELFKRIL